MEAASSRSLRSEIQRTAGTATKNYEKNYLYSFPRLSCTTSLLPKWLLTKEAIRTTVSLPMKTVNMKTGLNFTTQELQQSIFSVILYRTILPPQQNGHSLITRLILENSLLFFAAKKTDLQHHLSPLQSIQELTLRL